MRNLSLILLSIVRTHFSGVKNDNQIAKEIEGNDSEKMKAFGMNCIF